MARFCLVCFELVKTGKQLDEGLMTKLKKLDLQKYLDNQDNSPICNECLKKITKAFDFKNQCLLTEKKILPHISSEENQVNLKFVFSQEKISQNVTSIKNLDMCRLCLNLVDSIKIQSLVKLMEYTDINRVFQKHIPEINLHAVKNPLVCEECQNCLLDFTDLIFLLRNINTDDDITPAFETSKLENVDKQKPELVGDIHSEISEPSIQTAEENKTDIENFLEMKIKSEPEDEVDNTCIENEFYDSNVDESYLDVEIKSEPVDNIDISVESLQIDSDVRIKSEPKDETDSLLEDRVAESVVDFGQFLDVKIKEEPVDETYNFDYLNVKVKEEGEVNVSNNSEVNTSNINMEIKCEVKCEPSDGCASINNTSQSHYDLTKKLSCKKCSFKTNYYYSLKRHQLRHQYILRREKRGNLYHYIYECGKCVYTTSNPKNLQEHMLVHEGSTEKLQQCELCGFKTKLTKSLKRHVIMSHFENSSPTETCQICGVRTKHLKLHMAVHIEKSDGSYKCEICNFKTNHPSEMKMHTQSKHINQQKGTFKCNFCGLEVKHKKSLKKHIRFKHAKDKEEQLECEKFSCEKCNYITTNKRYMEKHIKVHDKNFGKGIYIYRCKLCPYNTVSVQYLKYHVESKHSNLSSLEMASYNCAMCKYKTKIPHYLRRHLKNHAKTKKVLNSCELCSYQTRTKSLLKNHVQLMHRSVKTEHRCELCDFTTDELGKLKFHILKHTLPSKIKMLKCDLCSYQTMESSLLIDHKLKHNSAPERKIMKCDICSFEASSPEYFKFHIESGHEDSTHNVTTPEKLQKENDSRDSKKTEAMHEYTSEMKCELCDFKTKELHTFRLHVLKHTLPPEIKTFQCELCSYQTKHKKSLEIHSRNHQTIKDNKCPLCTYRTVSVQFFNKHLLLHRKFPNLRLDNVSKNKYVPNKEFNKYVNEVGKAWQQPGTCEYVKNGHRYLYSHSKVIDFSKRFSTG